MLVTYNRDGNYSLVGKDSRVLGEVIERLLAPGQAMHRCILGKINVYFTLWQSSLLVVVAKPDEHLANRIQKTMLSIGELTQT